MPVALPLSTDKLNNPDHSALHRVIAADPSAPEQSISVADTGVVTLSQIPVGPASNPTTDNQLARKAYVDGKAGGGSNLVADFVVEAGGIIAQGDVVHINSAGKAVKGIFIAKKIYDFVGFSFERANTALYSLPIKLTNTKVCNVWADNNYLNACIINYQDDAVSSVGSNVIVRTTVTKGVDAVMLTPTKVVAIGRTTSVLYAYVLTISGDVISVGGETTLNGGVGGSIINYGMSAFNATQFIAFHNYGTEVYCRVGTVSGTTISYGANYNLGVPNLEERPFSVTMTDTQVVVVYRRSSGNGYARVGTRSGTTMDFTAEQQFASSIEEVHIAKISSTEIIVVYTVSDVIKFRKGTISGTTITWDTEYNTNISSATHPQILVIDASKFIFVWRENVVGYLKTVIGELISGVLYLGEIKQGVKLNDSYIFVAREMLDNSHYAIGCSESLVTTASSEVKYTIIAKHVNGIAKVAKNGGETLPVITAGLSDVHSGLTLNLVYYANDDGTIGTTKTMNRLGRAVSATSIMLRDISVNE